MSSNHQSPLEDTGGNINFSPFPSNYTNKSLINVYWSDIDNKPSFCNITFTASYNDLSNIPLFASVAISGNYNSLSNRPFTNINSKIGIGTNNPTYNLDINGDINFTGSLNQNGSPYQNSQWINDNTNIYFLNNIGIGKTTNINEIIDINGNLRITGNIYPAISSNTDLGSSNYKWRDLYLSSNSIFLDNLSISKFNNNYIQLKNNNLPSALSINDINIQSNNYNYNISLNRNGELIYNNSNYQVFFNNPYDYSNIILSNNLYSTSNNINNQIITINTNTITQGNINRFIINDNYNRNITFSSNLTTSNLITSNLTIIGDTTILNTNTYITEQLSVINDTTATALIVKQLNPNYNLFEVYSNSQIAFIINSNDYVGISKKNPNYNLDINGNINSSEIFIKGLNFSNLIDNKIAVNSNFLINYNNHYNKPLLSSIATTGNYNDLINEPFITNNNDIYLNLTGNIGFGITNPNYKLDINGTINTSEVFIKKLNISNIIDNKININSNFLINYNNHINKPSLSSLATSGSFYDLNNRPNQYGEYSNYNNLININWSNNQNNIYLSSSGFVGINNQNPSYKLDINETLNSTEVLIKGLNISNLIDNKISFTSNFLINYNNLTNKPSLATVATSGNYNDLTLSPFIINGNNIYSSFSGNTGIGTVSPNYKLDVNENINSTELLIKTANISNIIDNKIALNSNSLNTTLINLNTNTIPLGTNNRFITNDIYNRNITFSANLTTSNLITSNLQVIGDTTVLNTTLYITEQVQVDNSCNFTAFNIKQLNSTRNVIEVYSNNQLSFVVNSNTNTGIGINNPTNKLDVNGTIGTTEISIKGLNVSNIIDNKINTTSNFLINYNNLINKPSLATVATTGNYSYLINEPFLLSGNDIYSSYSGNTGIGTLTPNYKLDVNGTFNTNSEVLIKGINVSNIIDNKITITSNILVNYNNLINKPILATVATTGNYNDLINKPSGATSDYNIQTNIPFINYNSSTIFSSNNFNIGIGKTNPITKLDVNGDLNIQGNLRVSNAIVPFSTYLNTNITSSNGYFNYNSNYTYGYFTFLTSGSITFPQATNCDLIVVGAGGNGGFSSNSGGGGAGEVIFYPNYPFSIGTSNITVGYSDFNSNNRISRISSNNISFITALGGGNGISIPNYLISGSGSVSSITTISGTTDAFMSFTSGTVYLTLNSLLICDILVIGGGGGGGSRHGGGGGAGALIYATDKTLVSGSYTIIIGNGGLGGNKMGNTGQLGQNGGDTSISLSGTGNIYLAKGGGGGNGGGSGNGSSGGSGGGGGGGGLYGTTGGTGGVAVSTNIPSGTYGYSGGAGGNSSTNPWLGGGGGGSSASGINGNTIIGQAGKGGDGVAISITGTSIYYAGGGGGAYYEGAGGINGNGGLGGGTAGSLISVLDATANTGGGGGGGGLKSGATTADEIPGGNGGSGLVIIRIKNYYNLGGSGGGGSINNSGAVAGTKWNTLYSYSTAGSSGSATVGGNGGSATATGGFVEGITSNNLILGVGGTGASSTSVPSLRTTYGSGGDGNGGLGTQGIVIIKVPLNQSRVIYNGYMNYSNIDNRPFINELVASRNFIDIGFYNQVNFPLGDTSWANEWFLYMGTSPTNVSNSFIFWHLNSNARINSKWWFNGTTAATNNEISDIRIKKEIIDIINPLEKLMLLKPKEYYLCDEKDYLKKYGIIAQEVKEVLPDFVYTDEDYIANLYTKAIYVNENNSFKLITEKSLEGLININDELKILLDNLYVNNQEIIIEDLPYHNRYKKRFATVKTIIDNHTIEITEALELSEIEESRLFIYGKKVKDFLKLDYSSLYSLNIKGTQELYEIYIKQQQKLANLMTRLEILENKNN